MSRALRMNCVLWALFVSVNGFQTPLGSVRAPAVNKRTVLSRDGVKLGVFLDRFDEYKEGSRAYRRDVYDAVAWQKHRSTKRIFRAVFSAFQSGVLRGLFLELLLVAGVAIGVCSLKDAGVANLVLPAMPLTLTAPAVALLITFRTNQAYGRWWEARKIWGAVINQTRDLIRQAHWFQNTKRAKELSALAVAFGYALNAHCLKGTLVDAKSHIGDHATVDDKLKAEITPLIGKEATAEVLAAPHRPVEVCRLLTRCLAAEGLTPMLEARVDTNIATYSDYGGMCDRIQKTPMPLVYTRHTARFLLTWLLCVPSVLLGAGFGTTAVVGISVGIATLMLGIDELGIQIEEPFSVLPMDSYCNGLRDLQQYAVYVPAPKPKQAGNVPDWA